MSDTIKTVTYCRETKDWEVIVNGETIGWAPTPLQGQVMADNYVYETLKARSQASVADLLPEEAEEMLVALQADDATAELVELEQAAGVVEAQPVAADWQALANRIAEVSNIPMWWAEADVTARRRLTGDAEAVVWFGRWLAGERLLWSEMAIIEELPFTPDVCAHTPQPRRIETSADALQAAVFILTEKWQRAVMGGNEVQADEIEQWMAQVQAEFRQAHGLKAA